MKKQTFLLPSITSKKKLYSLIIIALLMVFNIRAQDPCSSNITINGLGIAYSQTSWHSGVSMWNTYFCGYSTPYSEKVYIFVAPTSGIYKIVVHFIDLCSVNYGWRTGSCSETGWNCIAKASTLGNYGLMSWQAGTTYYILLDADYSFGGNGSQKFYIEIISAPCNNITSIGGLGPTFEQTNPGGGVGVWNTPFYGYTTEGMEQIYSFVAPATGKYKIVVTSASGSVGYGWSSGSCSDTAWTCINLINLIGTYGSMYWTAGTTYYILLDDDDFTTGIHNFYLIYEPYAPNIITIPISSSQIDLSWNDVDGETGYKIYRAPSPSGTYSLIATTSANDTTYNDAGLSSNDDYCYKIKAYNNDAESVYSNESCATTFPLPPSPPTNLVTTAYSYNEINVSWNDVTNEIGYKIYRAPNMGGTYILIDSTTANIVNYYDAGLLPQTQYCYRVKAYNLGGLSYYSNESCATTLAIGVESYVNNGHIIIYPNLASDHFIVEKDLIAGDEKISIYSIQGQLLSEQPMKQNKTQINITNLDKGIYIVRVLGADINIAKKIIKE